MKCEQLGGRDCQADSYEGSSKLVSRPVDLALRAREHIRRYGFAASVVKVLRFTLELVTPKPKPAARARSASELDITLNLKPGDWVEVLPEETIRRTLDQNGRLGGLLFLAGMTTFCGQRYKVFKRMETMYMEESHKVRKLRNTVLLEGSHCDGLLMRCDRSCFFYWREGWLRKVDGPSQGGNQELVQIKDRK